MVELAFSEGSRKNKDVRFTDKGRAFSQANIVPSMAAERRAFLSLEPREREELLRLVAKYTRAIDSEIHAMMEREDS